MALIQEPSNEEITRQSEIEDNKKAVLEGNFRNRFNKWQLSILIAFLEQFPISMGMFSVSPQNLSDLKALISSHYVKVAEQFISGFQFENYDQTLSGQIYSLIENDIRNYINTIGEFHVDRIVETTEKYGRLSYLFALKEFKSPAERISAFRTILKNKLLGRTKATSYTETTGISGFSKQVALDKTTSAIPTAKVEDLKELQKISPNLTFKKVDLKKVTDPEKLIEVKQALYNPKKKWINMGDLAVRTSHLDKPIGVGNTIIPVKEPFVLDGGLAMFPGDQSLGIALNEVIGCRCVVIYI